MEVDTRHAGTVDPTHEPEEMAYVLVQPACRPRHSCMFAQPGLQFYGAGRGDQVGRDLSSARGPDMEVEEHP